MKPARDSVKECFNEIKAYLTTRPRDDQLITLLDKTIAEYESVRDVAEYMSELVTSLQATIQGYENVKA